MAYEPSISSGTGSQTDFTVPFPYLRQAHVKATVGGVAATFTWIGSSTIRISPAPANGAEVKRYRETPVALVAQLQNSRPVSATAYNELTTQAMYYAEEQAYLAMEDAAASAASAAASEATVVASTSASAASAAAAAASAAAADDSEAAAATSATNAATSASQAATSASAAATARTGAETAETAAEAAQAAAEAAKTAAQTARTGAETAETNAETAQAAAAASQTAAATSATNAANSATSASSSASQAGILAAAAQAAETAAEAAQAAAEQSAAEAAADALTVSPVENQIDLAGAASVVDADQFGFRQVASGLLKRLTWSSIKSTLKTYFDTLYLGVASKAADSDLLDGLNSTDFARTTARTAFASGTTGANTVATATGSLGETEIRNNGSGGGAAMMAFHRVGSHGQYFGLDTDNAWKVGGWTEGANSYKLWTEKTLPVGTITNLNNTAETTYRAWNSSVLNQRMDAYHDSATTAAANTAYANLLPWTAAQATAGTVGAYSFMKFKGVPAGLNPNDTTPGSALHYTSASGYDTFAAGGTWRSMGHCQNSGGAAQATLFLRIS